DDDAAVNDHHFVVHEVLFAALLKCVTLRKSKLRIVREPVEIRVRGRLGVSRFHLVGVDDAADIDAAGGMKSLECVEDGGVANEHRQDQDAACALERVYDRGLYALDGGCGREVRRDLEAVNAQ